jgi:tripartite-type tricarboxylate transporter receptor subunit TctC
LGVVSMAFSRRTVRRVLRVALIPLVLVVAATARAEDYPSRPVRVVVPYPAGGGTDFITRVVGEKLAVALGQQIVIDNRSGASGMIGADLVAKSAPDGYTLLMANPAEIAFNPILYPKMSYDPAADFAPVTLVGWTPLILAAHPSVPAATVTELIAVAKAKPGTLGYASAGSGGAQHLAGEYFKTLAGVELIHVPYRGAAPAVNDVVAGQVALIFMGMPAVMPHVRAGKLRGLAVTSPKRSSATPELPTLAEVPGLAEFDITNWFGLMAPARTPAPIIERLQREVAAIVSRPDVRKRLVDEGIEPVGNDPAAFDAFIRAESARYARIVHLTGAHID